MRRALLISPHFPPDSSAATHRVRVLAPHLSRWGWEPTVLTLEPASYATGLDDALGRNLPDSLRVVRCPAWPEKMTRRIGIGDLGLRSLWGMYGRAAHLLATEQFDVLFITIFPAYTSMMGPRLSRRFDVPFVLDYQDPWIGAWGGSVGGGVNGTADLKSRASRRLAEWIEPRVVRSAAAITAVSEGTYTPILERNPGIRPITEAIPIGAEPRDFETFGGDGPNGVFDPADGRVHIVYTGTLLPLGFDTLRAVLQAAAVLRDRTPDAYTRLRFHFVGTSNQSTAGAAERVTPIARELGVADVVSERPARVPYSAAVRLQRQASVLLAMGSSEPHYTASKIFPMLLARRPLLAVYHEASSVATVVGDATQPPSIRLVTYGETRPVSAVVPAIAEALEALVQRPEWRSDDFSGAALEPYCAPALAGRLASVFDRVAKRAAA
jgi:glycosyltransferase involved in cell wall biosynthesis